MPRRWLYAPFVIFGVIVFAYFLVWRMAAGEIEKGVETWIADQRRAGAIVDYSDIKRDGFPFFLRVHVDSPSVEWPGGAAWSGERLSLDALPYDLDKLIFSLRGQQKISTGDGLWIFDAEKALASIERDKARGWLFNADSDAAELINQTTGERVSAASIKISASPHPEDLSKLMIGLAARDIAESSGGARATLDSVDAAIGVIGYDILALNGDVASWRSAGGEIDIIDVTIGVDNAVASIKGALAPSQSGFPTGDMIARIVNPAIWTEQLEARGFIDDQQAEQLGAQLTLMAIAGGGEISAPIKLSESEVVVAGVPIAGQK